MEMLHLFVACFPFSSCPSQHTVTGFNTTLLRLIAVSTDLWPCKVLLRLLKDASRLIYHWHLLMDAMKLAFLTYASWRMHRN